VLISMNTAFRSGVMTDGSGRVHHIFESSRGRDQRREIHMDLSELWQGVAYEEGRSAVPASGLRMVRSEADLLPEKG